MSDRICDKSYACGTALQHLSSAAAASGSNECIELDIVTEHQQTKFTEMLFAICHITQDEAALVYKIYLY
jgi:hypothetical protein